MKYEFKKPVKFGDEIITEAEIREEYTVGDQARLQNVTKVGGDDGKTILNRGDLMMETLSLGLDWSVPKVRKIGLEDGNAIYSIINDFFAGTGK